MAVYDQNDFLNRLVRLFPKRWAGSQAFAPPSGSGTQDAGILYSLLYSIAGDLAFLMTTWAYIRLQTRLATMTDDDEAALASLDFFDGRLPRNVGESIGSFTTRIRQGIIAPTGFMSAVETAITNYIAQYPILGLGSYVVFDLNSDPARSAFYGVVAGQFAIGFFYPVQTDEAWYMSQAYMSQSTYLVQPNLFTLTPTCPYPILGTAINNVKDFGFEPVYIIGYEDAYLGA